MREDERVAAFKQQLGYWKTLSGKTQQDLCDLTRYFQFDGNQGMAKMRTSTFSRTARSLPFRLEGKYNLYRILAVYYLLKVIQTPDEIQEFLTTYDIGEIPDDKTWEDIWQLIQAGVYQYQCDVQNQTVNFLSNVPVSMQNEFQKREKPPYSLSTLFAGHKRLVVLACMIVGSAVVIGILISLSLSVIRTNDAIVMPIASPSEPANNSLPIIYLEYFSFGTDVTPYPGITCAESTLDVPISFKTTTDDYSSNDVIGLIATDGDGVVLLGYLVQFGFPGSYQQGLAVNLSQINRITARPVTVEFYDTPYSAAATPGVSSMETYNFILTNGTSLGEITIDPAALLPDCADLPLRE